MLLLFSARRLRSVPQSREKTAVFTWAFYQINLATKLIQPVLERKAKSFEISHDATDQYNDWLQKRLQNSVWTDCVSYYQAGRDSKTKVVATFPGPVALFWWFCRRPKWELYHAVGAEAWDAQRRLSKIIKWSLLTIVMSLMVRVGLGVKGTLPPVQLPFATIMFWWKSS